MATSIRDRIGTVAAAAALLVGVAAVNRVGDPMVRRSRPPQSVAEELIYFPSGRFLGEVSAGQRELVADLLWLRAVQYYGAHRQTDRTYTWAKHLFHVITTLNPRFVEAYRFGALVLATDAMDPEAGFDLLKRGFHANPTRWELPFELGFLYFLHHEDLLAGTYLRRAARLPGATEKAERFAAFAFGRGGREENARAMWTEMRDAATNPASRGIAEYALRNLDLAAAIDTLRAAVAAHRARHGAPPRSAGELVARGFLRRLPADPFGRGFLIDPATGDVISLFKVGEQIEQTSAAVEKTLLLYRQERGRFPDALDALTTQGYMTAIALPEGVSLGYDAATGAVVVRLPRELARAFAASAR